MSWRAGVRSEASSARTTSASSALVSTVVPDLLAIRKTERESDPGASASRTDSGARPSRNRTSRPSRRGRTETRVSGERPDPPIATTKSRSKPSASNSRRSAR